MFSIPHLPVVNQHRITQIEESRRTLVVTSPPAWQAVSAQLTGLRHPHLLMSSEATVAAWQEYATHCPMDEIEVVYAIGGGLSVDTAKYLAHTYHLPLVCIPTALTVDAFLTPASGIRRDGCVYYIPTKAPDTLILDLHVIADAPAHLRAAGVTDVLSIATGSWDWRFADAQGRNPATMQFIAWADDMAQVILKHTIACAPGAGAGDHGALKTLFDMLALEVQLCHQIGHSRPEEGSEHYFAYAVENSVGHGLLHGDLVGPGIMLMAERQGQDTAPLRHALEVCHIPLNKIPPHIISHTLDVLPAYCAQHHLPFGIAHVR